LAVETDLVWQRLGLASNAAPDQSRFHAGVNLSVQTALSALRGWNAHQCLFRRGIIPSSASAGNPHAGTWTIGVRAPRRGLTALRRDDNFHLHFFSAQRTRISAACCLSISNAFGVRVPQAMARVDHASSGYSGIGRCPATHSRPCDVAQVSPVDLRQAGGCCSTSCNTPEARRCRCPHRTPSLARISPSPIRWGASLA